MTIGLKKSALQSQAKHLTTSKVLLDEARTIAGFYSLAFSQVEFLGLAAELTQNCLADNASRVWLGWLGVHQSFQGRVLASVCWPPSLIDCYQASETFAFIAVILDCVDENAKRFYTAIHFAELPGYPMRLYLPFKSLEALAKGAKPWLTRCQWLRVKQSHGAMINSCRCL